MTEIRNVFDVGARALSAQMVRMNTVASVCSSLAFLTLAVTRTIG